MGPRRRSPFVRRAGEAEGMTSRVRMESPGEGFLVSTTTRSTLTALADSTTRRGADCVLICPIDRRPSPTAVTTVAGRGDLHTGTARSFSAVGVVWPYKRSAQP